MEKNSLVEMIHNREISHHDEWADQTEVKSIKVYESFESITALEGSYILHLMGDLSQKKLLDVGCGLGESSVYFALKGAHVVAMDISPQMVAKTLELARHHQVAERVTGLTVSAEHFQLPEKEFDIVYAANVFHHVTNLEETLRLIASALKPGGQLVCWDPIAYNPAINIYRRMTLGGNRTHDEHPLKFSQLKTFRKFFVEVKHREFWLSTLSLFFKYYLINSYDPNQVKYWKQIYEETERSIGWWFKPLKRLDHFLLRIPGFNYFAWNMVISARKPS